MDFEILPCNLRACDLDKILSCVRERSSQYFVRSVRALVESETNYPTLANIALCKVIGVIVSGFECRVVILERNSFQVETFWQRAEIISPILLIDEVKCFA